MLQIKRDAELSADGVYRYWLTRHWSVEGRLLGFIMLNPSTADSEIDDPTITRCMGFAFALGYAGILVRNLFAFRATRPADLWAAQANFTDVVGLPQNGLSRWGPGDWVAAWGAPGGAGGRAADQAIAVREGLAVRDGVRLFRLGELTKGGAPRHPLYLPASAQLVSL
jgi:hypothetical protein